MTKIFNRLIMKFQYLKRKKKIIKIYNLKEVRNKNNKSKEVNSRKQPTKFKIYKTKIEVHW